MAGKRKPTKQECRQRYRDVVNGGHDILIHLMLANGPDVKREDYPTSYWTDLYEAQKASDVWYWDDPTDNPAMSIAKYGSDFSYTQWESVGMRYERLRSVWKELTGQEPKSPSLKEWYDDYKRKKREAKAKGNPDK